MSYGCLSSGWASSRSSKLIKTNQRKEFLNSHLQNFFKPYQIRFFTTFSDQKASIVQYLNRTVKGIMFRLFTRNNNRKYIHFFHEIASRYNQSYHRSIKMKSIEVSKKNEPEIWINLFENKLKNPQTVSQQSRFSTGDLVRISIEQGPSKKGYLEGWSEELFIVKHAVSNNPTV